ncbi:cupredoxin domain-containing protein [Candidatus Woesearchaeota archaeon]|nr:cupredoxin domain-containing protein [Candidatus Woesearchaeota archaeon]
MKKIIILFVILAFVLLACNREEQNNPGAFENEKTEDNDLTEIENQETTNDQSGQTNEEEPLISINPQVKEFQIEIEHTSYTPNEFKVKQGDTVKFLAIVAQGTSSHNHGITIDEYVVNEAVVVEDINNPKIIEFVADKKGTFEIYCKTCWSGSFGRGHPDIKARLIVE